MRYTFFVAIICRVLISIYIGYQYIWFSSQTLTAKWGTFVEGIFDKTSYLPYLSNDYQSTFYQGLLFNNCVKNPAKWVSPSDLCRVYTEDNQHFTIALNQWFIWSDGTPVTPEDLYFTYNDIIHNNKWNIGRLDVYKDITVLKDADNKIKISFPNVSKENILFFAHYILPQHILQEYDLENYKTMFGVHPVYTNCANVVTDSVDPYSLIFNLANCTDTNLNFYQIKNAVSFDDFKRTTKSASDSIIDAYIWSETLNGYVSRPLATNKIVTVFFNTSSTALRVRTRRVLGWLIKHNFYTTGYENFMTKNTDGLLDVFQSTGADVKDLINRDYSDGSITKEDLIDTNVKVLPTTIAVTSEGQKSVYFVESWSSFPLRFTLPGTYDRLSIEYKGQLTTPVYDKTKKTADFSIWGSTKNFGSGLNKYVIYGYVKKDKKIIASLDIYNMISGVPAVNVDTTTGTSAKKVQLTVIYYDSPLYNFVVERMQNIFRKADISDNFVFQKITTPEELQGRLFAGDYDVLVSVVDMWAKKDFTKLLGTNDSQLNPSQYQNQRMMGLLQDYMNSNSTKQLTEINAMYSKDMPFIILWNVFTKLNLKPHLADSLWGTGKASINESNRRTLAYSQLQLVTNIHIDGKRVRSSSNFMKFLQNNLK
jgi:hypothetical protein